MDPKIEVVIASRKREVIVANAIRLYHDPIVCVDEVEEQSYRAMLETVMPERTIRFLTHPSINGIGHIRQFIMEKVEADVVFQADDDVHGVSAMPGMRARKIDDPDRIAEIIRNTAINCREAGTIFFWYLPKPDPRWYKPQTPFTLASICGGWVQGFWREEFNRHIKYDRKLTCKWNVDISAQVLTQYRLI